MPDHQEQQILQWFDEIEGNDSDEYEIDNVTHSDHDSDSEQSGTEEEFPAYDLYKAKSGLQWSNRPIRKTRGRAPAHNIVKVLPGVVGEQARSAISIIDTFDLFFTEEVLNEIVKCTNIFIERVRANYARVRDAHDTNLIELRACLGLLFLAGVHKSSHTNLDDLWQTDGTELV